jgi:predicted lactoylglutathione lyase
MQQDRHEKATKRHQMLNDNNIIIFLFSKAKQSKIIKQRQEQTNKQTKTGYAVSKSSPDMLARRYSTVL